jgi:hypothetical protein
MCWRGLSPAPAVHGYGLVRRSPIGYDRATVDVAATDLLRKGEHYARRPD